MTDLSKYAAGKRLRCEEQVSLLERGVIYTSTGCDGQYVTLAESPGYAGWRVSRFVPVEDEAPESADKVVGNPKRPTFAQRVAAAGLSPGHAIREPVRLNEAQREAVGKVDPYATHRTALAAKLGSENPEQDVGYETSRKPGQKEARDRLVAALRRDLDDGSRMKAFPKEGRLCRVYKENDR